MDPYEVMSLQPYEFGIQPTNSYDFFADLRRAQEESLKLARAEALEKQLEEQEAEQIRLAQQESMKEANVRKEALDRLQKRLACPWNLKINPNTDDEGNCQFDSAADQLRRFPEFKNITKQQVRARVVNWLRKNGDYKLSDEDEAETLEFWIQITQNIDWKTYCDKMSKDKVWGDEVTMKAITEEFGVRIFLWSSTVSDSNYFSEHAPRNVAKDAKQRSLLMCHVLEVHYCSLLLAADSNKPEIEQATTALPPDAQLRLLQALFAEPLLVEKTSHPLSDGNEHRTAPSRLTASLVERHVAAQGNSDVPALAIGKLIDLSKKGGKITPPTSSTDSITDDDFVLVSDTEPKQPQLLVSRVWHEQTKQTLLALQFELSEEESKKSDWIGLYDIGNESKYYQTYWKTYGASHGIVTHACLPSQFGSLELRWLRSNYEEIARSQTISIGPRYNLKPSVEGDKLLVTVAFKAQLDDFAVQNKDELKLKEISNQQQSQWCSTSDWLGLFALNNDENVEDEYDQHVFQQPSSNHNYLQAIYMTKETLCFSKPKCGLYEVRYFSSSRRYHCLSRVRIKVE